MPWQKNEEDGALVIVFGKGDLAIAGASVNPGVTDELIIYPAVQPMPIGAGNSSDIGKSTAEVKALVRMVFHDPRSLDVLIHQAQKLRSLMGDTPKWEPEQSLAIGDAEQLPEGDGVAGGEG